MKGMYGSARRIATSARSYPYGQSISAPSTASASDQDAAALGRFFYRNRKVNEWANHPAHRTTLRQLIMFGRSARRNKTLLMQSANYLRNELTIRVAHRLRDMQTIPFVAMSNEQLDSIYQFYWRTFETLRRMNRIETDEQNEHLIDVVTQLLSERKSKLDLTASICRECIHYMEPETVDLFLARMLRSQISREVLAKQHIALSHMQVVPESSKAPQVVGMIDTQIHVAHSVAQSYKFAKESLAQTYGWDFEDDRMPGLEISGDINTTIAYLPAHLEFIVQELFKVSMQGTMNLHQKAGETPPIKVRIVDSGSKDDVIIRISDRGGGLKSVHSGNLSDVYNLGSNVIRARGPSLLPGSNMVTPWREKEDTLLWSFHTLGKELERMNIQLDARATLDRTRTLADGAETPDPSSSYPGGDGLMRLSVLNMDSRSGLPIVRLYSELFGGKLDFRTLDGYGTDIYLRLPTDGTNKELHE